jgi:hypothetical protein
MGPDLRQGDDLNYFLQDRHYLFNQKFFQQADAK